MTISLPAPCEQNWDEMTPAGNGRHCDLCHKTVIDFTLMNDNEIINVFNRAKDNPPCGHFLETQLDRELIFTTKPHTLISFTKKIAAMLLLVHSSTIALAQNKKPHPGSQHVSHNGVAKKQPYIIKGIVVESPSERPLSGKKIIVNNVFNTVTDSNGHFTVNISQIATDSLYIITVASDTTDPDLQYTPVTLTAEDVRNGPSVTLRQPVVTVLPAHEIRTYKRIKYSGTVEIKRMPDPAITQKPTWLSRLIKPFKRKK